MLISLFALNVNAQSYVAVGTQITMGDDTRKSVNNVSVGDVVLSYNSTKNVYEKKTVNSVEKIMFSRMVRVVMENKMQILLTSESVFWSERGWVSVDREMAAQNPAYESAKECNIGDYLTFYDILSTSSDRIAIIEGISEPIMMYHLQLEGGGTIICNGFVVGAE
jgi:hypothetical protein